MRLLIRHRPRLRRAGRTRGQSLVEFALILPVFILFFGAVLDLGRLAAARLTLANAAREGAFQAAQTPTSYVANSACDTATNLVVCRVQLEAKSSVVSIQPNQITMTCNPSCSKALGNTVAVTVAGSFRLLMPFMAVFFGGSQNVAFAATSIQQLEALPPIATATAVPTATPTSSPSATPTPTPTPTPGCTLPSAGFTFTTTPPSNQAPVTMTVTDTSTSPSCPISTWIWDWGDGSTSGGKVPGPHTFVAPGTYLVTLEVTNATGSNTTGSVTVKVK